MAGSRGPDGQEEAWSGDGTGDEQEGEIAAGEESGLLRDEQEVQEERVVSNGSRAEYLASRGQRKKGQQQQRGVWFKGTQEKRPRKDEQRQ